MIDNRNHQIAACLRKIGNPKCLKKAALLEQTRTPMKSLHLRDLDLNPSNIGLIIDFLLEEKALKSTSIKSISLSYNPLLGDAGIIALVKQFPASISEIGLVACGIKDQGGIEVLNWAKNKPNLNMICIEQNSFSEKLRAAFKKFSQENPAILVVV